MWLSGKAFICPRFDLQTCQKIIFKRLTKSKNMWPVTSKYLLPCPLQNRFIDPLIQLKITLMGFLVVHRWVSKGFLSFAFLHQRILNTSQKDKTQPENRWNIQGKILPCNTYFQVNIPYWGLISSQNLRVYGYN
jgi:hypothetical protein